MCQWKVTKTQTQNGNTDWETNIPVRELNLGVESGEKVYVGKRLNAAVATSQEAERWQKAGEILTGF